jgi:hypothetical protein
MSTINTPNVKKPDPVDWTHDGFKPLPPAGTYSLKTTKVDILENRDKDGYLQAKIDAKIMAPNTPYDGHEVRFTRVTTRNWPNRPINSAAEYLKACGAKVAPQDDAGYTNALKATVNAQFKALVDWEAYKKDGALGIDINMKGMDTFPLNKKNAAGVLTAPKLAEGVPVPFVMAGPKADQKVYANTRIRFFQS